MKSSRLTAMTSEKPATLMIISRSIEEFAIGMLIPSNQDVGPVLPLSNANDELNHEVDALHIPMKGDWKEDWKSMAMIERHCKHTNHQCVCENCRYRTNPDPSGSQFVRFEIDLPEEVRKCVTIEVFTLMNSQPNHPSRVPLLK